MGIKVGQNGDKLGTSADKPKKNYQENMHKIKNKRPL